MILKHREMELEDWQSDMLLHFLSMTSAENDTAKNYLEVNKAKKEKELGFLSSYACQVSFVVEARRFLYDMVIILVDN